MGRLDFTTQNEFYNYAGRVLHNLVDESTLAPEVLKLHADIRAANSQMAETAYNLNVRYKHPLFVKGEVERNPDYLPVKYKLNKVFTDIYSGVIQESDYVGVITNGLKNTLKNNGLAEEAIEGQSEAIMLKAKAWVSKQKDRVTNKGDTYSFINNADVIDDYEQLVDELINVFGERAKDAKALAKEALTEGASSKEGISGRTRRRSNIDLTASYTNPETGVTVNLGDYVETNVDMLWKGYSSSMSGDVSLRRMGFESRADIAKTRDIIEKELIEAYGGKTKTVESELAIFDDSIRQFLGDPLVKDPDGVLNKSVELLNAGSRVSYLGNTWLSMLSEVAAVTMETGVRNMISYRGLREFFKGYTKNSADNSALLLEARIYNGLGNDAYRHSNRFMYEADNYMGDLGSTSNVASGFQDKASKATDLALAATKKAEEVITQIGGSKSGQSFLEQKVYTGVSSKVIQMATKGKIPDNYAKELGWSPETAEKIRQNILAHSDFKNKNVYDGVFNFSKWDADAELAFNLGVRRYSSVLVQKAYIGDTSALALGNEVLKNTTYGKIAMGLMQYTLMSHSKQLGRTLVNLDAHQLARQAAYLGGAAAGTYAYNLINFHDKPEELYDRLQPDRFAKDVYNRHPMSSLSALGVGLYEEATGISTTDSTTPRGLSTPAGIKVARDVVEGSRIAVGLMNDDVHVTKDRFNKWLDRALPNVIGMRYLNSYIADKMTVDEEFSALKGTEK